MKCKKPGLFVLLCSSLLFFSCKNTTANAEENEEYSEPAMLQFEQIYDTTYNGKPITLEGYFQVPYSVFSFGNNNSILFSRWANTPDTFVVQAGLRTGNEKNTMKELPQRYTKNDLLVYSDNGDSIRYGEKARIHGSYSSFVPTAGSDSGKITVRIDIHKIEKINENIVYDVRNIPPHKDPFAAPTMHDLERVYVEAYAEIPTLLSGFSGRVYLLLKGDDEASSYCTMRIFIDSIPNTVHFDHNLSSEKDVHLLDHRGSEIPFTNKNGKIQSTHKIRVYGIWKKPTTYGSGDLYVEFIEQL